METSNVAQGGLSNPMAGAAQYLQHLPSRGLFSSTVLSTNPGGIRVYTCVHDTSPPENQILKTDRMNILIRSLTLKKQKPESSQNDIKGKSAIESTNGKRPAERAADGMSSAKKANVVGGSGTSQREEIQGLTVERLRAFLKKRGLPTKGKKDELISRLINDWEADGDRSL